MDKCGSGFSFRAFREEEKCIGGEGKSSKGGGGSGCKGMCTGDIGGSSDTDVVMVSGVRMNVGGSAGVNGGGACDILCRHPT